MNEWIYIMIFKGHFVHSMTIKNTYFLFCLWGSGIKETHISFYIWDYGIKETYILFCPLDYHTKETHISVCLWDYHIKERGISFCLWEGDIKKRLFLFWNRPFHFSYEIVVLKRTKLLFCLSMTLNRRNFRSACLKERTVFFCLWACRI